MFEDLSEKAVADGIQELVVGGFVFTPAGEVLLLRRAAGDFYGGFFELPSGNVEAGEKLRTALIREIHEEAGISVTEAAVVRFIDSMDYSSKSGKRKRQLNFAVKLANAGISVQLSNEHDCFRWIKQSDANSFDQVLNESLGRFYSWFDESDSSRR